MVLWVLVPAIYAAVARLESWRRLLLLAAVAALGFALVFTPWWIRNARVLGIFVPIRTDFVKGADGQLESIATDAPPAMPPSQKLKLSLLVATTPWTAVDDVLWENNFHYDTMRVDFGYFPTSLHAALVPVMRVVRYYQYFLLLAAAAALLFVRRSPRLLLAFAMALLPVVVHANTQVNPRYAFLGTPALIVLAGAGAYGVWHLAARRLSRT
jgi:hypothetical protein